MTNSKSMLKRYVQRTAGVRLGDESLARGATASETAGAALDAAASMSLFDTEPAQLANALDEGADPDAR